MRVSHCPRCGQSNAEDRPDEQHLLVECPGTVCELCRADDRQPQGEAVRLFTPAPAVMPGQLDIGAEMHGPDGLGGSHA